MNAHNEQQARQLLALGLDEFGHHTEAANVRKGIDLDDYKVDLWAIRAALDAKPSPVVKQNLTTQPAAAQEAVAYWRVTFRMYPENIDCCETFVRGPDRPTLDTLGISPRPVQIISTEPLYAAPVTAAPADLIERCREILAWQRTGVLPGDALRAYANARWPDEHDPLQIAEKETAREAFRILAMAAAASTPAAPGIDMGVHGATLTIDGETFTVDEVRPVLAGALADAKRLNFLIRTYSHLRMRNGAWVVAVGGETPTPGEGYPTACAAIDAAMQAQAGDAEVQP